MYKTNSFLTKLSSFQIMVSLKSHVCWALLWFQGDILFLYIWMIIPTVIEKPCNVVINTMILMFGNLCTLFCMANKLFPKMAAFVVTVL